MSKAVEERGKRSLSEELRLTRETKAKDWRESNMVQDEISALWTLSKFDLVLKSIGGPHNLVIFQSFVKQKMRVKVSHKAYDN